MPDEMFAGQNPGSYGGFALVDPAGAAALAPTGFGAEQSVFQFRGAPDDPNVVSVGIAAGPAAAGQFPPGPLTGIVLFGSGNQDLIRAEFDIPSVQNNALAASSQFSGGVIITVPATNVEVRARHDGNLVPPTVAAVAMVRIGNAQSVGQARVSAGLALGPRSANSRVTRTIWIISKGGGAGLAPTDAGTCLIPPFAQSVRVLRSNNGTGSQAGSMRVGFGTLNGGASSDGGYDVAAGAVSPEFPLGGTETTLTVLNNNAAITLEFVAAIFYLNL